MDIEKVFAIAKRQILERGRHLPTIIAEFGDTAEVVGLVGFGEPDGLSRTRQQHVRQAGYKVGQRRRSESFDSCCFICEIGFALRAASENVPPSKVSQDTRRREGIMVWALETKNHQETRHLAEIVRAGESLDLVQVEIPEYVQDEGMVHILAQGISQGRYSPKPRKKK